ncbi:hypothetical protein T484DRAFT_1882890 [Baffinella frigidus]|nr:hypothetical protein T484DRAFT_1882890 [Cryptophyta sp. CCMP2293]
MRLRLRRLDSCWAALFLGPLDKGLFRDAECLAWALLRAPVRRAGKVPGAVSVFLTRSYAMLDAALAQATPCVTDKAGRRFCTGAEPLSTNDSALLGPIAAPEGTEVAAWLAQLDTLVVFESPLKSVFRAAHAAGVHSKVLVLNVDWTDPAQVIALALATPGVSLWVKGHATLTHLAPRINPPTARRPAIPLLLVPWSIPDAVVRHRKDLAAEGGGVGVRFLFIAGFGGVLNRRGGDIVLEAFRLLKSQEPAGAGGATLDFYSVRHPALYDHPVDQIDTGV